MGRMVGFEAHSFLPVRLYSKLQMQPRFHLSRRVTGEGWGSTLRKVPASKGAELLRVELDVRTPSKPLWYLSGRNLAPSYTWLQT